MIPSIRIVNTRKTLRFKHEMFGVTEDSQGKLPRAQLGMKEVQDRRWKSMRAGMYRPRN